MGFMEKWQAWSQKQWDNWGHKLQPKYDEIANWQTPEWAKVISQEVWDLLDPVKKKLLYDEIMRICKKFDKEFALELIKKINSIIKKLFG